MFPSWVVLATLNIAGPSFVGGAIADIFVLNVHYFFKLQSIRTGRKSPRSLVCIPRINFHDAMDLEVCYLKKYSGSSFGFSFRDRQFSWSTRWGFGMSWRAIRHATVETRILEQIECLKDSGMKDSGKNSTLANHQIPFLNIWVRVKIQGMDQGPGPTHDPYPPIHTLIHTPWYCMIHTLDPYPWSIPLIRTPFSLKKDWCWP